MNVGHPARRTAASGCTHPRRPDHRLQRFPRLRNPTAENAPGPAALTSRMSAQGSCNGPGCATASDVGARHLAVPVGLSTPKEMRADAVGGLLRPPAARRHESAPARWHSASISGGSGKDPVSPPSFRWLRQQTGGDSIAVVQQAASPFPPAVSHLLNPFCYRQAVGQGADWRNAFVSANGKT